MLPKNRLAMLAVRHAVRLAPCCARMKSLKTRSPSKGQKRPSGQLNFSIPFAVQTLDEYGTEEMVKKMSALCNRPALHQEDRIAVCRRGFETVFSRNEPVLHLMRAIIRNHVMFACMQVHVKEELSTFTSKVMSELAGTERSQIHYVDVVDAITLLCYNLEPSAELIQGLKNIESLVVAEIRQVQNVQVLMQILRFAAHRENVDDPQVACPTLVKAIFQQLGFILRRSKIPPRIENTADLTLRSVKDVWKARVKDDRAAEGLRVLLNALVQLRALKSVVEASHLAFYFSSHFCTPLDLFRRIGRAVDDRTRTELKARTIDVYVRLNWAFQAQGLQPPLSSLLAMRIYFKENEYCYDPDVVREVQLLAPFLQESKSDIPELMQRHAKLDPLQQPIVEAIQSQGGNCMSHVWLECGLVPVVCLPSEDPDQLFLPWPEDLQPADVDQTNVGRLPVKPVALFLVEGRYIFSLPSLTWQAQVEHQRRMLLKRGWRVALVALPEISTLSAEEAAKVCLDRMRVPRHAGLNPAHTQQ